MPPTLFNQHLQKDLLNPESARHKADFLDAEQRAQRTLRMGNTSHSYLPAGVSTKIWMTDLDGTQHVQISNFKSSGVGIRVGRRMEKDCV